MKNEMSDELFTGEERVRRAERVSSYARCGSLTGAPAPEARD